MASERPINLAPLERANARLGRFIAGYQAVGEDDPNYDVFQTAVVKGYEFTYELAYAAIRRYVADYVLSPAQVGQMRAADIIRAAGKNGLIEPPEDWLIFRQRRNATAHEYFDEDAIQKLIDAAPRLYAAVEALLLSVREKTQ